MELHLTVGLPGSGKSTWALQQLQEHPDWVRANRDTIRAAMFSETNPWRPSEKEVTQQEIAIVDAALTTGKSVIVDDTNLSEKTKNTWFNLAKKHYCVCHVEDFTHVPLQTCIDRDKQRTGKARVGEGVIQNMALRYNLIQWPDKPIVIVDIDGTLANANHRLHHVRTQPKNWPAFFAAAIHDPVNEPVYNWVCALAPTHTVTVVSGRALDQSQEITVDWLREKNVPYNYLFMRNSYDYREDWLVKSEILRRLPQHLIDFSIDDRWQVVEKCWRANGVRCYPVSETDGRY